MISTAGKSPAPVVLSGLTVVDTRTGTLHGERDVVLIGDYISAVTPTSTGDTTSGQRIDLSGKYVVPGFVECHAHVLDVEDPSGAFDLMLVNGITAFRQMSGTTALLGRRRRGRLSMPDRAPALLATPGAVLTPINAGSANAAVTSVREQHAAGADFIKVGLVTPDVFFAAQQEAKRLGIPILGHLPTGIDVRQASTGGMRSIEHLGPGVGVLAACSTDEAEIRAAFMARMPMKSLPFRVPFADKLIGPLLKRIITNPVLIGRQADRALLRHAVATFNEERARVLAAQFVADGTWHCPTLIRERATQFSDDPAYHHDPNLRFVPPAMRKAWGAASRKFDELPSADKAVHRDAYTVQLALTRILAEAGVKLLAGSDAGGAVWEVPGFALHQEFDQLAAAGISAIQVLQSATLHAAEFFGMTDTMGTVEVGKQADLVVLDANPVESVVNLHRIAGVFRRGRWYPRPELDSIAERVAERGLPIPERPTCC
jgi:imidazolonepropionase-like amidohydrolase